MSGGPISFAEFMDVALYHPRGGYYMTSPRVGRNGDFTTSPEIHPAFGALAGRFVTHSWKVMGNPTPFTIVEVGGGTGRLALDMLTSLARTNPAFYRALDYVMVEVSPAMRRRQKELLRGAHPDKVSWRTLSSGGGWPVVGCVISNELVDALPVCRVVMRSGRLMEMCVGVNGQGFAWVERTPCSAVSAYLESRGMMLRQGQVLEVRPAAAAWMREVAANLARGCALTIDHGYESHQVYRERFAHGSLMCYAGGMMCDDPLQRPGLQDISARVDFEALQRYGKADGLTSLPLMTQRDFLLLLGAGQLLDAMRSAAVTAEHKAAERRALLALLDAEGLGACKVLLQHKGLSNEQASRLADFSKPGAPLDLDALQTASPRPGWLEWQGAEV
jgi:SAM-dependent MidA family methyltransferase